VPDIDTDELNAIRIEISEAIKRRAHDDRRPAAETFTVTSMAVAEVLADLIHGAAKDAKHADHLMTIMIGVMSNRMAHREKTK
jgi:hypothetical protein